MAQYSYTRELVNGAFDITNKNRVDELGNQIYLAKEINDVLPGKLQRIVCNGTDVTIFTSVALTAEEKTTMDGVVAAHKANT